MGATLTLSPSGWTYKRTFVLYDKETGSLWLPDDDGLMAIQGEYFFQQRLSQVIFEDTGWREVLKEHPESKTLK